MAFNGGYIARLIIPPAGVWTVPLRIAGCFGLGPNHANHHNGQQSLLAPNAAIDGHSTRTVAIFCTREISPVSVLKETQGWY
jgi:hypothetical protein